MDPESPMKIRAGLEIVRQKSEARPGQSSGDQRRRVRR